MRKMWKCGNVKMSKNAMCTYVFYVHYVVNSFSNDSSQPLPHDLV
jgi:hypothetical protein